MALRSDGLPAAAEVEPPEPVVDEPAVVPARGLTGKPDVDDPAGVELAELVDAGLATR
jgi:hypothetical protein